MWYHVISGSKIFMAAPNTSHNKHHFEIWSTSHQQASHFLGDALHDCVRIILRSGDTLFFPSGWPHAVSTPEDSIVIGGNFIHVYELSSALEVFARELRSGVARKFQYPYFKKLMWYIAYSMVQSTDNATGSLAGMSPFQVEGLVALYHFLRSEMESSLHRKRVSNGLGSRAGSAACGSHHLSHDSAKDNNVPVSDDGSTFAGDIPACVGNIEELIEKLKAFLKHAGVDVVHDDVPERIDDHSIDVHGTDMPRNNDNKNENNHVYGTLKQQEQRDSHCNGKQYLHGNDAEALVEKNDMNFLGHRNKHDTEDAILSFLHDDNTIPQMDFLDDLLPISGEGIDADDVDALVRDYSTVEHEMHALKSSIGDKYTTAPVYAHNDTRSVWNATDETLNPNSMYIKKNVVTSITMVPLDGYNTTQYDDSHHHHHSRHHHDDLYEEYEEEEDDDEDEEDDDFDELVHRRIGQSPLERRRQRQYVLLELKQARQRRQMLHKKGHALGGQTMKTREENSINNDGRKSNSLKKSLVGTMDAQGKRKMVPPSTKSIQRQASIPKKSKMDAIAGTVTKHNESLQKIAMNAKPLGRSQRTFIQLPGSKGRAHQGQARVLPLQKSVVENAIGAAKNSSDQSSSRPGQLVQSPSSVEAPGHRRGFDEKGGSDASVVNVEARGRNGVLGREATLVDHTQGREKKEAPPSERSQAMRAIQEIQNLRKRLQKDEELLDKIVRGMVTLKDGGEKLKESIKTRKVDLEKKTQLVQGRVLSFVDKNGKRQGPFTSKQIKALHRGGLCPEDAVIFHVTWNAPTPGGGGGEGSITTSTTTLTVQRAMELPEPMTVKLLMELQEKESARRHTEQHQQDDRHAVIKHGDTGNNGDDTYTTNNAFHRGAQYQHPPYQHPQNDAVMYCSNSSSFGQSAAQPTQLYYNTGRDNPRDYHNQPAEYHQEEYGRHGAYNTQTNNSVGYLQQQQYQSSISDDLAPRSISAYEIASGALQATTLAENQPVWSYQDPRSREIRGPLSKIELQQGYKAGVLPHWIMVHDEEHGVSMKLSALLETSFLS